MNYGITIADATPMQVRAAILTQAEPSRRIGVTSCTPEFLTLNLQDNQCFAPIHRAQPIG